jgi:glycosyltransferase involved in cell wall biosynthesis
MSSIARPKRRPDAEPTADGLPFGGVLHAEAVIGPEFDAALYAREYRDVEGDVATLLRHFCERGWKEGRNPNAGFDTVSYLLMHPDVAEHRINPFFHYLLNGRAEARAVTAAFVPSEVAARVFGRDPGDWVALMRPAVDVAFYTAALQPPFDGSFDPVAHYCYRGWLEGRDPNPGFSVRAALEARPALSEKRLNPLLFSLVPPTPAAPAKPAPAPCHEHPSLRSTRFAPASLAAIEPPARAAIVSRGPYHDPGESLIAQHLDADYYLDMYPDVRRHGADPVTHYYRLGWAERRNRTAWFDTAYYLDANADVAERGINPFWHYLMAGQAEGRSPKRPGGYRRTIIDQAADPDEITKAYLRPEITETLSAAALGTLLRPILQASKGLAISLGHDRYLSVTGGIQLFIAEEQARFAKLGMTYLNISPVTALLRLADLQATGLLVNLVLDGRFIGVASYNDLSAALHRIAPRRAQRRLFLVHCLLGHNVRDVVALQRASASQQNFFWVHDYSSLCAGFNLLRNDVSFCGAPPPDSMACRVCVYGDRRPLHLAMVSTLFEAVSFHVVAPSHAALDIWRAHTVLPHASAMAHGHCDLVPDPAPPEPGEAAAPVRVAFIGYPRAHKGWPIWQELVSRCMRLGSYRFLHLGAEGTARPMAGVEHRVVAASPEHPDAMLQAVADLRVDLVLVGATWPETFSYVTYEALAGGADVVCLADSGNVADTVLRQGRGVVAANEASLLDFFETRQAVEYVARARAQGTPRGRLVREGTTATLRLVANPVQARA